jgi:hypothetical protein
LNGKKTIEVRKRILKSMVGLGKWTDGNYALYNI